jgi:hypothetical protein
MTYEFDQYPQSEIIINGNASDPSATGMVTIGVDDHQRQEVGIGPGHLERLHRSAMRALPQRVLDDALRRSYGIGSRLHDLYKIFFATNYFDDLRAHKFATVAALLRDTHERRKRIRPR